MTFSSNVDLGQILVFCGFILTLWRFHQSNVKRLYQIDLKVSLMWKEFAHRFNLPIHFGDEKDE